MTDEERESRIEALRNNIHAWANRNDLWQDAHLRSYSEHFRDQPRQVPCVLVLVFDGQPLYDTFNGYRDDCDRLLDEFSDILNAQGFEWEREDGYTVVINPIEDETGWYSYYYFRWLCDLVHPGYVDVSAEVAAHFHRAPEDLHHLSPRAFEVLVDAIFRNNGFRTELGPGTADNGVDVRLFRSDLVGEMLTLVQMKRYKSQNPIGLEAVAALKAIVDAEGANSGLFITTSRYLPVAQRFARRSGKTIQLADKSDVAVWCATAADTITREAEAAWVKHVLDRVRTEGPPDGLVGRIVHAWWGYNMRINDFRLIVRATKHAVLLAPLGARITTHDGYMQSGFEVPDLPTGRFDPSTLRVALRSSTSPERDAFWVDKRLFTVWDGEPKHFYGD
ncbi:MAG TPA: restriction endonuclease [Longimicrobiaceae bacterium]